MEEAVFEEIGVFIKNRHNMVARYIATWPIMDLCERSVQRPGDWVYWRWWEQKGIYQKGAREWAVAATDR